MKIEQCPVSFIFMMQADKFIGFEVTYSFRNFKESLRVRDTQFLLLLLNENLRI